VSRLPTVPRFPLVVVVAVATLATACGSNDAEDGAMGNDPANEVPAEEGEPGTSDDIAAPLEAPIELTATFRGVTAETIKVGVVAVDLEDLRTDGTTL